MHFIYIIVMAFTLPMILGWVKTNAFYGYRTRVSLSSNDAWFKLNRWCGIHFFIISAGFLILNFVPDINGKKVAIAYTATLALDGLYLAALQKRELS